MPTKHFDFIIVGGGAIGLAIAYELSKTDASIALFDAPQAIHQASWAAAGIIPPADVNLAHAEWQRLVARGHQLHPIWAEELREQTGVDVEYVRCGAIHFARTPGESAALAAAAKQWSDDGIESEQAVIDRLRGLEPHFSHQFSHLAAFRAHWVESEARIRPPRYLKALKAACKKQGVTFVDATVNDWSFVGDRVDSVVWGTGERANAAQVCLATGAWTGLHLERIGLRIELKPWRGQVALLQPQVENDRLRTILNEGPNYLVPRCDGRVVVGSTVEDVGFCTDTTEAAIEALLAFAREVVPTWEFRVESTWSGLRPGTGDGFPYLGWVPQIENVFVATGHFRNGIALSPATAELVTVQLLTGRSNELPSNPFRLNRE